MARALGGGALVLPGGRGVRQALRQRDDPYQPRRGGESQAARTAGISGERPARALRPGLPGRVPHRGTEWADRVAADRATAYRIHLDTGRDRWYLTASWQTPATPTLPIEAALAHGVVGVDMNADHLAAWRLDIHGNPACGPRRFSYDLTGTAEHRDAQVRHALTRLLHWARTCGVKAIAVEDLDFTAEKTREKHGGAHASGS